MSSKSGGIVVEITSACELGGVDAGRIEEVVMHICERFSIESGTVGIGIVDDEGILKVNEQFLDSSAMTDVISFDLSDEDEGAKTFELVVNYDEAVRQGEVRGHGTEAELALYVAHGLLHNLGYDDLDEVAAKEMHEMEDVILQDVGFGTVYDG